MRIENDEQYRDACAKRDKLKEILASKNYPARMKASIENQLEECRTAIKQYCKENNKP